MYDKASYDSECSRMKDEILLVIEANRLKITTCGRAAVCASQDFYHSKYICDLHEKSYCATVSEDRDR
jgi:hypothetical protein